MCYSFSAKGTVANLVADSLQQCGEQELAGWFFVGEGAGLQYASNIAAAMYNQFRLAFSKAFAGVEKSLDEAAYDRACAMCSQMTGVVLLRSVGQLEGIGEKQGLRYEVHEFAFPLPRQKLKQEIRARLKSNAELEVVEENSNTSANVASSSSVFEVVDLISDDEEQNDDTPVIFLEDTRKSSLAPRDTSGEADEPLLDVALASSESIEAAAFPASCMDTGSVRTWQDIALEQWQQATCYERWLSEWMAIRANPDHATDLYDTLDKQRQAVFASVMQNMSESRSSMVQASIPESGCSVCHVRPKGNDERAPAAVNTNAGKGMLAGKDLAPFAKLRIGFRARASVDRDSQRSATGELAALSQQPAQPREDEQQCGQDRPDPHEQMLDLSLHEYDKACSTCCHLLNRAHAKAQLKSQPGGATGDDECPLILNSVVVSILHEAFSRAAADGVHGVLAGFKKGDQIVVTHARATSEGLPTCSGDGESDVGLTWLREQAQKLFPQAILHPETKFPEICGESLCNAGQDDRSGRECIMATKEENSNALGAEVVQEESCAASREVVKEEDGSNALSHPRSAVQCNGLHVKTPPCRDLDDVVRAHQAADVQERSGGEELNLVVKEHPDEDQHCGAPQVENQQSSLMPEANPKVGMFDGKEEGTDDSDCVLTVLGYFRVACTTSAPDAGEVDRRRLCALNGRGIGLVCTVQKSEQVLSSPDLAKFMCFGVEEQPASQMAWEVQQDPFLPGRVLRQWASASQDEARDQEEAEAAATLVTLHTMNLRLQEAYIKRQLSLSSVTSLGVCRGVFRVGRQLHTESRTGQLQPADQAPDEQARHSASPASRPEHAARESGGDYAAPYETCAGAPGKRVDDYASLRCTRAERLVDFDSAGARFRQAGENITYQTSRQAAGRRTSTIQKEVTIRNGTRHQGGSTTGRRQDNSTRRAQTSLA